MLYLDPSSRSPSECAAAQPIGDSVEKLFRPALCTENFPSRALPTILSGGVCSCRHLEWLSVTNRRGRSSIDRRCSPVDDRARIFEQHRARMCSVAYRMLGSRSDAEDVVQDAYLRWHRAPIADIRAVEAWLVTVVTLILAVAMINMWNRLNVALRTVPGDYKAGMFRELKRAQA
jgi:Sigma-70 region 2